MVRTPAKFNRAKTVKYLLLLFFIKYIYMALQLKKHPFKDWGQVLAFFAGIFC